MIQFHFSSQFTIAPTWHKTESIENFRQSRKSKISYLLFKPDECMPVLFSYLQEMICTIIKNIFVTCTGNTSLIQYSDLYGLLQPPLHISSSEVASPEHRGPGLQGPHFGPRAD